jgi:4-amino-4-deoxy-L-arabinose transferase-like glycosyltransferase
VSETYALRLVLEGRWSDPAWSANIVDRSNPPVGKYVFGVAALLAGEELPKVPSLSRLAGPDGVMEPYVAAEHARPYLPLLAPARRASALAIALTVGLVTFAAARLSGVLAAAIACAWCAGHWLTWDFGGDAIFDPLLTLLVFATCVLVCHPEPAKRGEGPPDSGAGVANRRGSFAVFAAQDDRVAPLLGIVCALAFQTRLNGGIALAASLAALLVRKQWWVALFTAIAFVIVAIALNPYYWPGVVEGFEQQVSDLRTILHGLTRDGVRLPLWAADSPARTPIAWTLFAKLRFAWIALGGALLAGAIAGCWFARQRRDLLVWCGVVILGTLVWLPLPWARYLLVVLPPLALLAGIGYAGVLRAVFDACMWRMRQPRAS